MTIGFTAQLTRKTPDEPMLELPITVNSRNVGRHPPMTDELVVLLRDLGQPISDASERFQSLYGRIHLRWPEATMRGVQIRTTLRIPARPIAELRVKVGAQRMAEEKWNRRVATEWWNQVFEGKVREMTVRQMLIEELAR